MIGPKKLSAIQRELRHALGAPAKNPIQELDRLMSARGQQRDALASADEVIQSLKRFLQRPAAVRARRGNVAKKGRVRQ